MNHRSEAASKALLLLVLLSEHGQPASTLRWVPCHAPCPATPRRAVLRCPPGRGLQVRAVVPPHTLRCVLWPTCACRAPCHAPCVLHHAAPCRVMQVVGRKYVRLYPPSATGRLYPFPSGLTTNSSQVDLDDPAAQGGGGCLGRWVGGWAAGWAPAARASLAAGPLAGPLPRLSVVAVRLRPPETAPRLP